MTPERLARLRFLANFAAYHVPSADSEPSNLMDTDAGDDMLELCDAVDAASEVLATLRAIVYVAPENPFSMRDARFSAWPQMIDSARDAIAKAEGA